MKQKITNEGNIYMYLILSTFKIPVYDQTN